MMSAEAGQHTGVHVDDLRAATCRGCDWTGMVERGDHDSVPRCPACNGLTEALRSWLRYPCPECGCEATIKSPHQSHAYCRRYHAHEDGEAVACPPVHMVRLEDFARAAGRKAPEKPRASDCKPHLLGRKPPESRYLSNGKERAMG